MKIRTLKTENLFDTGMALLLGVGIGVCGLGIARNADGWLISGLLLCIAGALLCLNSALVRDRTISISSEKVHHLTTTENETRTTTKVNDYVFTVHAGEQIIDGKGYWPDLVRLRIPKDEALQFALDVLNRLDKIREGEEFLYELPLFGKLERLTDD